MITPSNKITVGHCSLYDHNINIRRARLLIKKFKELKFDPSKIINADKHNLGTFITEFGTKLIKHGSRIKDDELFADGFGKALGELFTEGFINCSRYDRITGISDYTPGFVLGIPDHGVEGSIKIKFKEYERGTLQAKFTLSHFKKNTCITRNKHKTSNFYQQSVEDYGMDDLPLKTRKKNMCLIGNFETNHKNTDGFYFVLKDQLELCDGDKAFWQEWFDCLYKLSTTNIKKRSNNKITLYPSQSQDVLKLKNVAGQDNSSCGDGKSVKMHYLQEEALK